MKPSKLPPEGGCLNGVFEAWQIAKGGYLNGVFEAGEAAKGVYSPTLSLMYKGVHYTI
ncbi:MAG: hypothetical protein K5875_04105 [Saccharofermentans sp.]|nr:hypothetical protein [Saccharofermentans sp.]